MKNAVVLLMLLFSSTALCDNTKDLEMLAKFKETIEAGKKKSSEQFTQAVAQAEVETQTVAADLEQDTTEVEVAITTDAIEKVCVSCRRPTESRPIEIRRQSEAK